MKPESNDTVALSITQPSRTALGYCALGVLAFSFTLPATRLAAAELSPGVFGFGRAAVAGLVAALLLWSRGERLPARRHWPALACVALGGVLAFPWLTSLALHQAPAHHAVVVVGLTPLATALFSRLRGEEHTPWAFWGAAGLGAAAVLGFLLMERELSLVRADLLLVLAVLAVAAGYAEGGRAAAQLGGVSVICWALVAAGPFSLLLTLNEVLRNGVPHFSWKSGLAFAYVSLVSQVLGFCAWYRGLSGCGVARGSQVQLLQPGLSLLWCGLLLGEALSWWSGVTAAVVVGCVLGAQRGRRDQAPKTGRSAG
jgi:drug/metabolite transporter (DMT)-like permease